MGALGKFARDGKKTCNKCGETKPVAEFNKRGFLL